LPSRIVVIDIQAKRLDEAKRFGATDIIDSTKTKPVEAVRDFLPGGADHVHRPHRALRALGRLSRSV
jgi:S-(hydroxymethyl)glutathione dehydrogenase/alcohol dehydrogenase